MIARWRWRTRAETFRTPPCPSSNWLPGKPGMTALSELGLASLNTGCLSSQPLHSPDKPFPVGFPLRGKRSMAWLWDMGTGLGFCESGCPHRSPLLKATPNSLGLGHGAAKSQTPFLSFPGTLLLGSFLPHPYLCKSIRSCET